MKKLVVFILTIFTVCVLNAQTVIREGYTFKQVSVKPSSKADTLLTNYKFEDSKGLLYPIIINRQTGRCWIWRKSSKSGKMYKSYLKEEICLPICKELNINYTPKQKKS